MSDIVISSSINVDTGDAYTLQAASNESQTLLVSQGVSVSTTADNGVGIHAAGTGIGVSITIKGSVTSPHVGLLNSISDSTTIIGLTGTVIGDRTAIALDGDHTIRNFGAIAARALNGVGVVLSGGKLVLFNNGSIDTGSIAIASSGGDDVILNEGSIKGLIDLGAGNDTYFGKSGTLTSTQGILSRVNLGSGDDWAYGGAGSESFYGDLGNDYIDGGAGIDTAVYFGSAVTVDLRRHDAQNTGEGWDTLVNIENITSGSGMDTLTGDQLANVLKAGANQDVLDGGGGNDSLDGGRGDDVLNGGDGFDVVIFQDFTSSDGQGVVVNLANTAAQNTSYGIDTLTNIEGLIGTSFADTFTGSSAANTFWGKAGNDTLDGAGGNDTLVQEQGDGNDRLIGGSGLDTVTFSGSMGATVDLARTAAQNTAYGSDIYSGIENLSGGSGHDRFAGNGAANVLKGNAGNDTLDGGYGRDVLTGGTGRDTFVFKDRPGSTRYDRITDYNKSYDSFQLDNRYMPKLGAAGRLSSSKFVVGSHAKDADDHLIYDRSTGKLYYDADGSGAGAQVLIALFTNKAALTYGEFTII